MPRGAELPAHATSTIVRSQDGVGGLVRASRREDATPGRRQQLQEAFARTTDNRRSTYGNQHSSYAQGHKTSFIHNVGKGPGSYRGGPSDDSYRGGSRPYPESSGSYRGVLRGGVM